MKAALVGADGALLHQARRATGRERGPDAVVESILDFAAELRAHGERHFGEPAVGRRRRRPRHRRRRARASRSTRPTSAGATYPCGTCSASGCTASRSPSATTCAPAASPRDGSARAGAPTASCSCRSAPASRARSASTAGWRRARTASRARSATSSYDPGAPRAVRAARLPGAVRVRVGGESRPGPRRPATLEADAADCAQGRRVRRPPGAGGLAGGRRRARRRPRHRAHPAGPAHADHRWRPGRGRGNLVHTATGGGRATA